MNKPPPTSNMVYVSMFLVCTIFVAGVVFFIQSRVALHAGIPGSTPFYGAFSKVLTAVWFTLIALVIFLGFFWAFRGFPPGSRLVVGELSTENDLQANQATFLFFYTQWCPYSQDAIPKVKSLSELVGGFTYGGKVVTVNSINCESEEKLCNRYGVTAYPTYKLITASKVYEYSGPPRTSTYEEFIVTALGAKEPVKIPV